MMAINLYTRTETISIPGVMVPASECVPADQCCIEPGTPGTFDCETPDLGTLPETVVVTISGPAGVQSGMLSIWEESTSPTNDCAGNPWSIGDLTYLWAWPSGSSELKYLGLFENADFALYTCTSWPNQCDYHVYALSKTGITPGSNNGVAIDPVCLTDAPGGGPGVIGCCCNGGPGLYYDRTLGTYSFEYATGRSVCGQIVGGFAAPCGFKEITTCDIGTMWFAKDLIDDCVGVACEGGTGIYIPNGDTLGGLYCNAGTIDQYPVRVRFYVYRQAFLFIPQDTSGVADCCLEDGLLFIKTYLVRRRWFNDGVANIINEPAIAGWQEVIPITFDGGGTITGEGTIAASACSGLNCGVLEDLVAEINA